MNGLTNLREELRKLANPSKAKVLQRFFKTGKGEYGEGDRFLGITVPQIRTLVKKYHELGFSEIDKLLHAKFHEERLLALLILVEQFEKGGQGTKKKIFEYYLKNSKYVNNWDLVDLTAPKIVGQYVLLYYDNSTKMTLLDKLAKSDSLWEKRIAVLATFVFIRNNKFEEVLKIAEILFHDQHNLIQKAVGWMLREIGKRNLAVEEEFLKKYAKILPRTMLRYAIEKFPEEKRKFFLGLVK